MSHHFAHVRGACFAPEVVVQVDVQLLLGDRRYLPNNPTTVRRHPVVRDDVRSRTLVGDVSENDEQRHERTRTRLTQTHKPRHGSDVSEYGTCVFGKISDF